MGLGVWLLVIILNDLSFFNDSHFVVVRSKSVCIVFVRTALGVMCINVLGYGFDGFFFAFSNSEERLLTVSLWLECV